MLYFIGVGNNVYQRILSEHGEEQQKAVQEVEERIRSQLIQEKEKALKESKERAEEELEKAMISAKKAQVSYFSCLLEFFCYFFIDLLQHVGMSSIFGVQMTTLTT